MAGILDITALAAEFKAFYLDHGQNMSSLRNKIIMPTDTEEFFDDKRVITDDVTEVGFFDMDTHAQGWQANFTPTSTLTLEVERAQVTKLKIDLECVPDELESTWYGFLISKDLNPQDYPFMRWWMELAIPAYKKNWELFDVYKGIKAPIVANTATAKGGAVDGIEKIIKDGITAGKITPNLLGAPPSFTAANAAKDYVQYIEQFIFDMPKLERELMKPEVLIDINRVDMYELGRRQLYSGLYNPMGIETGALRKIRDTNFSIKGVSSMEGKDRIFTTRMGNAYNISRRPDPKAFRILPIDYEKVKLTTKWSKSVGFWYLPWVKTTNVD
jgi:hypothetical protein